MKTSIPSLLALGLTLGATAGPEMSEPLAPVEPSPLGFDLERRPISNPTLFDSALPQTRVHAFFMHHRFPDHINTTLGKLDFGGDLNLFAIQFEYAFNERLSLVATKDGYIDFNPDHTFSDAEGFANLAGGLKYAFLYDPDSQFVASGTAVVEFPTGNRDVFQGEGDGSVNLILSALKLHENWQFAGALGAQIPFDDAFSTQGFASFHVSYETCPWFIPLVEFNYFTVLDSGDGDLRYKDQVDGLTPAAATFEGADLINWGAAASDDHDYATCAVGFRSRLTNQLDFGFAWEFPLTDEEDNITEDRFTVDLTFDF